MVILAPVVIYDRYFDLLDWIAPRETPETQQKMDDEQHHNQMVSEDGRNLKMIEAVFELFLKVEALEKHLKNQQTGEGSELLILEPDHRNFMELCLNL